jgi:hypothetical protein
MSLELDPAIWDRPGYILTADRKSSIALCGGWEMSLVCGRGPNAGSVHYARHEAVGGRSVFVCANCGMPLHEIWVNEFESEWMSIEPHVIEEIPW